MNRVSYGALCTFGSASTICQVYTHEDSLLANHSCPSVISGLSFAAFIGRLIPPDVSESDRHRLRESATRPAF